MCLRTPSSRVLVTDVGTERVVCIRGSVFTRYGRINDPPPFKTPLQVSTLKELSEATGDWFLDEIQRRADRDYVAWRLVGLIQRFRPVCGTRILDVGSGKGSSALILADAGAAEVQGVEPEYQSVQIANHRATDEGVASLVRFTHLPDCTAFPFQEESFDVATLNAVLEHVPPHLRAPLLREVWRCLRSGGLLVITETPNRLFPYDGHTSNLPVVPWLPLSVATQVARKLSRHTSPSATGEELVSRGIIGSSYWQVTRALPDAECLNRFGGDVRFKTMTKRHPLGIALYAALCAVEWGVNRVGLPLTAFTPILDLVLLKPARLN